MQNPLFNIKLFLQDEHTLFIKFEELYNYFSSKAQLKQVLLQIISYKIYLFAKIYN